MIKQKSSMRNIEIDLTGPCGNAFYLLGQAKKFCKNLDMEPEESDRILEDMQSDDYEHLVEVFDEHFGNFVTLIR